MKQTLITSLLAILGTAVSIVSAQETLKLAQQRTVSGLIELSAMDDSNIVFVSIDLPNAQQKYDGNIEAIYMIELQEGVIKPKAAKAVGTLVFKDHESLTVDAGAVKYVFSRLLPSDSNTPSDKRIVDLMEGRRSRLSPQSFSHADLVKTLGVRKHVGRKPPGL